MNILVKEVESRKLEIIGRSITECDNLLDLGAGDGGYLPFLANKAKNVVALEINRELCNMIKQQGYEVILADAMFLPFRDDSFDCVWASEIVEHMPSLGIFDDMERVSRQTIVITMPNPWSPHFKRDPTHILKYSLYGLKRSLGRRDRSTGWSYSMRGLGFYWIPVPNFIKKLTCYGTYYLPWLSPTVAVFGRSLSNKSKVSKKTRGIES